MSGIESTTAESQDRLELKWGTLKGWSVKDPEALEALRKYVDSGVSISCMAQDDTAEQKALICDLIRKHKGTIINDWSGEEYTKDQAIDYVNTYGVGE